MRSRYYDPEVGRFLNADGYISTGQGVLGNNMFTYCGNNPVNRIDLSGMNWWNNVKNFWTKTWDKAKTWVNSLIDSGTKTESDWPVIEAESIGIKTTNGIKTNTTIKNNNKKGKPLGIYSGTSTDASTAETSNSIIIKNNMCNSEIEFGMTGLSYTRAVDWGAETSVTNSITSEGYFEIEFGYTVSWDSTEVTNYASIGIWGPTAVMALFPSVNIGENWGMLPQLN